MTIREFIIKNEIAFYKEHIEKLDFINAPEVLKESARKELAQLEKGEVNIGGKIEHLDYEFEKVELRKGVDGKQYVKFDDKVNYFPNAKYGRFLADAEERSRPK